MSSCARRRLFWCGVIFGLCTILALLSAVGGYVSELGMGHTASWELFFRQHFKNWYACGLLALVAIWVSARNPLQPGHSTRWVLRHLGADFVLAMMIAVLTAWLVSGERSVRHPGTVLTFPY